MSHGLPRFAGLIALREMSRRLGDDHANAQVIAHALAKSPHISIDPAAVRLRPYRVPEHHRLSNATPADSGLLGRPSRAI